MLRTRTKTGLVLLGAVCLFLSCSHIPWVTELTMAVLCAAGLALALCRVLLTSGEGLRLYALLGLMTRQKVPMRSHRYLITSISASARKSLKKVLVQRQSLNWSYMMMLHVRRSLMNMYH